MIRRSELLILHVGAIDRARARDPGPAPGFLLLHPRRASELRHGWSDLPFADVCTFVAR